MKYGIYLLDTAAEKCGSFYKLAQRTGVPEQNISAIRKGRRKLPLSWVYELATIAEIDPADALRNITKEQAANAEKRDRLGKSAAAGAAAMLLFFYSSSFPCDTVAKTAETPRLTMLYIV